MADEVSVSIITHPALLIIHQLSGTIHPLSGIIHQQSGIIHQLSGIIHQLSGIIHPPFFTAGPTGSLASCVWVRLRPKEVDHRR